MSLDPGKSSKPETSTTTTTGPTAAPTVTVTIQRPQTQSKSATATTTTTPTASVKQTPQVVQVTPAQKVLIKTIKLESPSDIEDFINQQEGMLGNATAAAGTSPGGGGGGGSSRGQPPGDNTINVPAFLGKLWKMVNDPDTDHLISWNTAGNSFVIQNQAQFWYELLPVYYKHNNMSSFVRQLNMYGFHKVSCVENGTMDADRDEIVFFHPCFRRDRPELLRNIKRKVTAPRAHHAAAGSAGGAAAGGDAAPVHRDELTKVLVDVKQIRGRQAAVDNQLSQMKQENAVLWRELALLRQKHLKQQQIVNKLIHFLLTLVQPTRVGVGVAGGGVKRRPPLMLCEKPSKHRRRQHHPHAQHPHHHQQQQQQQQRVRADSGPSSSSSAAMGAAGGSGGAGEDVCPQAGPAHVPRGPTIHELDVAEPMQVDEDGAGAERIYDEVDEMPLIDSPPTSAASSTSSVGVSIRLPSGEEQTSAEVMEELSNEALGPDLLWDKPELIKSGAYIIGDDGEMIETLHHLEEEEEEAMAVEAAAAAAAETTDRAEASTSALPSLSLRPEVQRRLLLNPDVQDPLLSTLANGNYSAAALRAATVSAAKKPQQQQQPTVLAAPPSDATTATGGPSMAVATKDGAGGGGGGGVLPDIDELHSLVGSTQSDLDQLKDILAGCNGLDANALLGLFGDVDASAPEYGLSLGGGQDRPDEPGNELSTYGLNMIDFNELFGEDSVDGGDANAAIAPKQLDLTMDVPLSTPQVPEGDDGRQQPPSFPLSRS